MEETRPLAGWEDDYIESSTPTFSTTVLEPTMEPTTEPEDFIIPPTFSEDALASRFTDIHGGDLRYVAAWNQWLIWEDNVWRRDETMKTFDRARAICRQASSECNDPRVASRLASATTVAAIERLAKSDRQHAATVDQWDRDHLLLNTPKGVVDLRTGRMRHHQPEHHMTKITSVEPGGECPQWLAFMDKITLGDRELQSYLQRCAGYCLTGSTREHALFFCYGTGGNGKGVFLNTLTGILSDYATIASMETFTASANERHPTDLAMLRGARLVTAQETEEGRKWAEAKIKAMTGGDPITARFMRQDFFTFQPAFKLFIAGNHKPGLRNVDEAIRRRFNLIPFDLKLSSTERDLELPEKLKAEWPGILKWMIHGCLEWQRIGLAPPEAVSSATAEYFEAEDAFGQWLAECCVTGRTYDAPSATLFTSWTKWADMAGERAGSQKQFSQVLLARGFQPKKYGDGRAGFLGISAAIPINPHYLDDR